MVVVRSDACHIPVVCRRLWCWVDNRAICDRVQVPQGADCRRYDARLVVCHVHCHYRSDGDRGFGIAGNILQGARGCRNRKGVDYRADLGWHVHSMGNVRLRAGGHIGIVGVRRTWEAIGYLALPEWISHDDRCIGDALERGDWRAGIVQDHEAVSYTHLTLPT